MQYAWPGNVRELSNLIERLLILYPNQIVDVADLPGRYRLLPCEPRDERLTEMDERDALAAVFQSPPELDPGIAMPLPMQLPQEETVEAQGQVDFDYTSSSCSIWDPVQIVCGQAQ